MTTWADSRGRRQELIRFLHKTRRRGFDDAAMASVSERFGDQAFLIVAADARCKLSPESVAFRDLRGNNLGPDVWPGDDCDIHRSLYAARPDVKALVHAQPPYATSFAAAGKIPNMALTQEILLGLDETSVASYHPRRTDQLSAAVVEALGERGRVVLIRGVGVLTLGSSIADAFRIMQLTEMAARLTFLTRQFDNPGLTDAEQRAAWEV